MRMPLSVQIALRFSKGRSGMVSLIAVISTIGIALGVAVLITGLSAMNGFKRELNNRILAVVPHGEIEPVNQPENGWLTILTRIQQVPGILAAAPYLNFTGLIARHDKLQAIQIKGVDPVLEKQLNAMPRYVQHDAWSHFQAGQHQIIIGKGVAYTLQAKLNDWLTLMIPNSDAHHIPLLQQLKRIRLQVRGIVALNGQLDHSFAIVPLLDAQNYLKRGNNIVGIAVKVRDVFNANQLVWNAGEITNIYVKIHSWIDTYGYMYRDIQMIRAIMYLAMVLLIAVACFNIVSTLMMAVKDKSPDIAILRTLGSKDELIRAIFIGYGLLIGLTGSVSGAVIGVSMALNLTTLMKWFEYLLGHQLLSGDVYFIDFIPSALHWMDVISVLSTALLLSFTASWYPALRASRIAPARVLNSQ